MMKNLLWGIGIAGIGLAMTGCSGLKAERKEAGAPVKAEVKVRQTVPLFGTEWILDLKSLPGTQSLWEKPATAITLVLTDEGRVGGCAGVNRYFGESKVDEVKGTLSFGQMGATMMFGPGMEYERAFIKVLGAVDGYRRSDKTLTLFAKGKEVAVFHAKQ